MTAIVGYPDEVWVAIKTLWESVPKITLPEVRRQVGEAMDCETPSEQVIGRKIKAQKWKKAVRRISFKHPKSVVAETMSQTTNRTSGNIDNSIDSDEVLEGEFTDVSSSSDRCDYPLDPTPVFNEAKRVLKGVERTIKNHRLRNSNLGEMQDTLVDQFEDVLDVKLDTANENFESEAKKLVTALRVLQLKTGVLTDLAIANKAIQSSDRESWGIESSGDDSTNELRKVDSTILDKKLNENRAALTKQKEEYVQEKMKRIESGEIFNQQEAV